MHQPLLDDAKEDTDNAEYAGFKEDAADMKNVQLKDQCRQCGNKLCSISTLRKKLPCIKWIPKYGLRELQCDAIAGFTVGLTVIPQGLAYSKLAGLPPQYGLYSAFMGSFIYCFLGTSKDITLGPTAIMSLMTATFATSPIPQDPTYAIILSLVCGVVQLVMGTLNLGILVNFISYPVINAFTSAAAVTISFGQVKNILGLKNIPREFGPMVYETFAHIGETRIWDTIMGLCSLVILFLLKKLRTIDWKDEPGAEIKLSQKIARKVLWLIGTGANAVIVIAAAGIVAVLHSQNITGHLSLTGHLKEGLPPFKVPSFSVTNGTETYTAGDIFSGIGMGFFIVPVLGLVETIAIGKAFARRNNYVIDASQELIAIGAANIIGSFVSSYPVTGSFSRTAVNAQSGVRTPANGIFTGAIILLALAVLTPLFYYIPNAALGAVIISAVVQMVDFAIVKSLWKTNKMDLVPHLFTFVTSLAIGIEYGILIGIGVSLLILLYPVARPPLKTLVRPGILLVQPHQGMLFPAAEYISESIVHKATKGGRPRSVVLDFQHIVKIDYSAVQSLKQLFAEMKRKGQCVVLVHVQPQVMFDLHQAEIPFLIIRSTVDEACEDILAQADGHEMILPQDISDEEHPALA
ncbi:sodium-independent sulfate anion transporter-like [Gigantopelta aegis]|uniref:sodium-independent sulfate anion transporter-like n=1 Tax=Gigantopelta aegis TaxID=1735272 RepID=UPI001B88B930|nr:sodium-independent sulfate anion transporter-like [Gigantopelta aegis]